jgi:hypothetical protein
MEALTENMTNLLGKKNIISGLEGDAVIGGLGLVFRLAKDRLLEILDIEREDI